MRDHFWRKKVRDEALLDVSRKEEIEFTILRKKNSIIKIIEFKRADFNKHRALLERNFNENMS